MASIIVDEYTGGLKNFMDILKFINSKDIAEYLRKINYQFSPEEAMFLIHEGRNIPITEKHTAYEELIKLYPNYQLKERREGVFKNQTLASYLSAYIKAENELIENCKKEGDDAIYYSSYYSKDEREGWIISDINDSVYHTFDECFNATIKDSGEFLSKLSITKKYIKTNKTIELDLLPDGAVLKAENFAYNDEILSAFEWMWINIPTPFKKGDILIPHTERVWDRTRHEEGEDAFVLTQLFTWGSKELADNGYKNVKNTKNETEIDFDANENLLKHYEESGDTTDMLAFGYFIGNNGGLYHTHTEGNEIYLNYEIYRGELTGTKRILKAISAYLKGEIPLELFIRTYQTILNEERAGTLYNYNFSYYSEDLLKLIGLK